MSDPIKKLNHGIYHYRDVVRCTREVRGSGGKRYTFVGAVFLSEDDTEPDHFELIEQGRGQFRAIRPQFVVKDVARSKDAQARILAQEIDAAKAAEARAIAKETK